MSEQGRLEYWQSGVWELSAFEGDLNGFVCDWLCDSFMLSYRWVEGGAVVYLPRRER